MSLTETATPPNLRLIPGLCSGARAARPRIALRPAAPATSESDLALDMAHLYLASLQRDVDFQDLASPACRVRVGQTHSVPLSVLKQEVSNVGALAKAPKRHDMARLPRFFDGGLPSRVRTEVLAVESLPARDAAKNWEAWLSDALDVPLTMTNGQLRTPGALSTLLHENDPAWLPLVALGALSRSGLPLDPGLQGDAVRWSSPRIAMMMLHMRDLGKAWARRSAHARRSTARPSAVAARMSLMRCGEAVEASVDTEKLRCALDILQQRAPTLLAWVSLRNQALAKMSRSPSRLAQRLPEWLPPGLHDNVLLPRYGMTSTEVCPVDTEAHSIVFGACLTVLKAACDSCANEDLQHLTQTFGLARDICDGFFPSETWSDLLLGEALAIQSLQTHLEGGFGPAALRFHAFDGSEVSLTRSGMGGKVALMRGGVSMLSA